MGWVFGRLYDFSLHYHPRKANIVANALSQKPHDILANLALEDWKSVATVEGYNLQYHEDENVNLD